MAELVLVPRIPNGCTSDEWRANSPGWSPCEDTGGKRLKPLIRCNCGAWSGIRLHHVHEDGTVTASFWHAKKHEHPDGDEHGCGWHVMLKLLDYDQGDFPPGV
jgi:hypothetical protein